MALLDSTQARQQVLDYCQRASKIVNTETLDLDQAVGRVLAGEYRAAAPFPNHDRSMMDGFAVHSSGCQDVGVRLKLNGSVAVDDGDPLPRINSGQAMKVATGSRLPPGADAVVMREEAQLLDHHTVQVNTRVKAGEFVLPQGADVKEGQLLLEPGQRLRPVDISLLAAHGIAKVEVFLRPRVSVISTGDELVEITSEPGPGQVRNSNAVLLASTVETWGASAVVFDIVPDNYDALLSTVRRALESSELVLISGGTSVGDHDYTARVLGALGPAGVLFHGITLKPGKPTLFADCQGKPAFGLPGNPVSAAVSLHYLVRPLVKTLAGQQRGPEVEWSCLARLTAGIDSPSHRDEFVRVRLSRDGEQLIARPLPQESALLTSMSLAGGLVHLPVGQTHLSPGTTVRVLRWESF